MYGSNRDNNIPSPRIPRAYLEHLNIFRVCSGRREFDGGGCYLGHRAIEIIRGKVKLA